MSEFNETEFKSCVKELPTTCMIDARITDNVLEKEDWGIDQLYVENGIIRLQDNIIKGVYSMPDMLGWTSKQLMEWSHHDNTGSHPEQYHEIKVYTF